MVPRVFIIALILTFALPIACAEGQQSARSSDTAGASVTLQVSETPMPTMVSPPGEPPMAIFICLDASGSYPTALLARARNTIADLLDQRVQPGRSGTRVGARWITATSRSEEALLVDFAVGPVPPVPTRAVDPPPPAKPDLDDVAYRFNRAARERAEQDWQAQIRAWETEVARNEADYRAALTEQERALAAAQAQMQAGTERIRSAPPPAATGSDVGGCTHAAARALARQPGNRVFIIASDLVPWGEQDLGDLSLTGVQVRVAFHHCQRVSGCDQERQRWTPVFAAAGAASIDWYEPDENVRTLLDY